ncbi:MAG: signal recognition particle protein, partial [Ruminococcaceae bacterium]|nr:signal recognition particle protein [Oscillospiraceae bacterium]
RYVTGKPIKFAGVGEKLSDLEQFHPDRMASRILGMGDVLTLIEKAEQEFDAKAAEKLEQKMRTNSFNFNDFLEQLANVKKMGPLDKLLEMIPGIDKNALKDVKFDPKEMARVEGIIHSMTDAERENPDIINPSRKRRIAAGSGMKVEDVNRLLKRFEESKKMMKKLGGFGKPSSHHHKKKKKHR